MFVLSHSSKLNQSSFLLWCRLYGCSLMIIPKQQQIRYVPFNSIPHDVFIFIFLLSSTFATAQRQPPTNLNSHHEMALLWFDTIDNTLLANRMTLFMFAREFHFEPWNERIFNARRSKNDSGVGVKNTPGPASIRPPLAGNFLARGITLQWRQKDSYEMESFCGVKISTAKWSQKDDLRGKNDSS